MNRYTAIDDPACYSGTQVLRNKADLQSQGDLDQFEQLMYLSRADESIPTGDFNYAHYKFLHKHFFQDVYEWAGEPRTIRTGKGTNWFCYPEFIDAEMQRIFTELSEENFLLNYQDKTEFAARAAYYISEINAIHPFREGNGRMQLTLLTLLAENVGYKLNEDQLDEAAFMSAMINSFEGQMEPLKSQIEDMI